MKKRWNVDGFVWRVRTKGNGKNLLLNIRKSDFPYQLLHVTRRRFALSLFYCQLLCAPTVFSQRSLTSFGTLSDCTLGYRPSGLAVGAADPFTSEIVVLAQEQPSLNFYAVSPGGRLSLAASFNARSTFRYVTAVDINNDRRSEYLAISENGSSLSVFKRTKNNGIQESEILLASPAQKCVSADVNNDKRDDILLFGKNTAGVETLLRQPNGTFRPGPTLFQEISAGDLCTADINDDGITDILLLDWLSNQLAVFYGIGRMVYTEHVAVRLPSEPGELAMTSVSDEHTFRVAVTFPETRELQVYSGNSLGDYRLMTSIDTGGSPAGVQFAQINADEYLDLVTSTTQGVFVSMGTSATSFAQPVVFGAARSIAQWIVTDADGDGRDDCVLIDQNSKRLILLVNADYSGRSELFEYCVGTTPRGLIVADFNGNGKQDIAVVNFESSSLSILMNRGRGRFSGQVGLPLPNNPTFITAASTTPGRERTFVVSHATQDKTTIVDLADDLLHVRTFSIPSGTDPFVLLAKEDTARLQFLVRYRSPKDKSFLLSSFEQINPRQFLERSLRATLPTKIIALNADEGVTAGTYELLFATNDKSTKQTTISFGMSETGLEFKTTKPLFSFPDSTSCTKIVMSALVNSDPFKDVLVALGPPRNELGIWYGKAPSVTRDTIEWIHNVQPTSDDAIFVKDVNGDGAMDITLLDGLRHSIVVLYGSERKGFRQPVVVAPAEGVYSMRIAALRDNYVHDLVMSNSDRGTVSIIYNPFGR